MSYDPAVGTLLKVVADKGGSGHFNATTRFTYNAFGQPVTALDPVQTLTSFAYDFMATRPPASAIAAAPAI